MSTQQQYLHPESFHQFPLFVVSLLDISQKQPMQDKILPILNILGTLSHDRRVGALLVDVSTELLDLSEELGLCWIMALLFARSLVAQS